MIFHKGDQIVFERSMVDGSQRVFTILEVDFGELRGEMAETSANSTRKVRLISKNYRMKITRDLLNWIEDEIVVVI